MNVILMNQFFWPDSAPTARLLTDLANHLAERGWSVTVFCGSGTYAKIGREQHPDMASNIKVFRCPTFPFARNLPVRLLSYATFLAGSIVIGLLGPRPDLVITLTTPPLLGIVGTILKRFTGARHFSWEMDLYPEVGIDLGVFDPHSRLIRELVKVAALIRRRADGILALGPCMRQRLIDSGVDPRKISVTGNWANGEAIFPMAKPAGKRRFTVHYSGNLGIAHDIETISAAMDGLKDDDRFEFIFVGGGPKRAGLERFCADRQLHRVRFLPYCDAAELAENFSRGDVGLVTQHKACFGTVVPSKLYAYLAAGTPVLYIGPRQTTPALIIERHKCGWHIDCDDSAGLRRLLNELGQNRGRVAQAGRNARQAFLENYDLPMGVSRIGAAIELADSPGVPAAEGPAISAVRE